MPLLVAKSSSLSGADRIDQRAGCEQRVDDRRALPVVQSKKAEVLWSGGGPWTNANEQPPATVARSGIARKARSRGGSGLGEGASAVPIVIGCAAL